MDEGDFSGRVDVRMGVLVGFSSVCGPSGVRNADDVSRRQLGMCAHQLNRIGLVPVTGKLGHHETAVAVRSGETRRIVTAILQNGEAVEEKVTASSVGKGRERERMNDN